MESFLNIFRNNAIDSNIIKKMYGSNSSVELSKTKTRKNRRAITTTVDDELDFLLGSYEEDSDFEYEDEDEEENEDEDEDWHGQSNCSVM